MEADADVVQLKLSQDEALVLFEWLTLWDKNGEQTMIGSAEEKVLWSILAQLESSLVQPFAHNYMTLLAEAKQRLLCEGDAKD